MKFDAIRITNYTIPPPPDAVQKFKLRFGEISGRFSKIDYLGMPIYAVPDEPIVERGPYDDECPEPSIGDGAEPEHPPIFIIQINDSEPDNDVVERIREWRDTMLKCIDRSVDISVEKLKIE